MKKQNGIFLIIALAFTLVFNACNDDDDPEPQNNENLAGEITEEKTLDATVTYKLDGALVVKEGGVLNIPAGTVIEAKGGTTSYIAVAQGGKINVNGTSDKPVVMTSDKKIPGSWGGVVICGKAPVNTGASSTSEVGGLPYGGDVADDNSGTIKNLRVEYTGYIYTNEKQFNGVSFFGVGSGTTVEYVVSYMGNDDGIEFFGGTVNASYLVSVGSNDDGIDFADGWSGTGSYWYSLNSKKSGIEGSNNGSNGAATPMTNATLKNITVYGMGEKPWYLKEGAGKQNIDNVVIGGLVDGKNQAYFYGDAADKDQYVHARVAAEEIVVTNVAFVNMGAGNETIAMDGLTITEKNDATGAGNGIQKPSWMSDALNTVDAETKVIPDAVGVEYEDLKGDITGAKELDATKRYKLDGAVVVKEGATLTIPAGTVIEAVGSGTISYIAVAQGGKINVNGTADKPVIMTCDVKTPGSWGGLVVCGKAPVNTGASSTSEVGGLPYGGTTADDNSGSITYLRVEYTGYIYTNEKQFNGVSFFGVGSGTTVEYLVSYNGNDDGIEFFGGTVNAKYLLSVNSNDDGIDFADGWSGTGEYWYALNSKKSGIEGSNNGSNGAATPMTDAKVSHVTVYGMGEKPWYLKEGAGKQTIDDVVIGGLVAGKDHAIFYADDASKDQYVHERIAANDIKVTNVKFVEIGSNDKAVAGLTVTEGASATGAGNGTDRPTWVSDALNTIGGDIKIFE